MKILLIDDHKLFSKSIQMSLEIYEEFEKVDIVEDVDKLGNDLSERYDIVLVDINLTTLYEQDGLVLAESLIKNNKDIKVVILTGYTKPMYSYRAREMGAFGFINKSIDVEQLILALKRVNQGGKVFSNEPPLLDILTNREIAILRLIRQGLTIDDICEREFISKRTVSNHLSNIFDKFDVSNRQEAIFKAESLGYFEPD